MYFGQIQVICLTLASIPDSTCFPFSKGETGWSSVCSNGKINSQKGYSFATCATCKKTSLNLMSFSEQKINKANANGTRQLENPRLLGPVYMEVG